MLACSSRSELCNSEALGACAKAQAWPFALELFGNMLASKLQPDAVSRALRDFCRLVPVTMSSSNGRGYNVVIGACERSSQWEAAAWMLNFPQGPRVHSGRIFSGVGPSA